MFSFYFFFILVIAPVWQTKKLANSLVNLLMHANFLVLIWFDIIWLSLSSACRLIQKQAKEQTFWHRI